MNRTRCAYFFKEWSGLFWTQICSTSSMVLKQKLHTLANWSVVFSEQSTEDTIPEMEFGMPIRGRIILWAYRSIFLNVEDYITKTTTGASISTLSRYQLPEPKVGLLIISCSAVLFIFRRWCCVLVSVSSNFCEWQIHWTFPFSYILAWQYIHLCLMLASIMLCSAAVTSPKLPL